MTAAAAKAQLPAPSRKRLAKLLGMLGSNHAGERDAAGLAAHRLVRASGVTWEALLAPPPMHRELLHSTWRRTCAELLQKLGSLRPWERKFVADLPNFQRLSSKQRYVLFKIAERVLGVGAGRSGPD